MQKRRARTPAKKSGAKSGTRPGTFSSGIDPRRGRGPQRGAENAGRPPDVIRRICRERFAERIPRLVAIADGEPVNTSKVEVEGKPAELHTTYPTVEQRMKAIEMLGKYGVGTAVSAMGADGSTVPAVFVPVIGESE